MNKHIALLITFALSVTAIGQVDSLTVKRSTSLIADPGYRTNFWKYNRTNAEPYLETVRSNAWTLAYIGDAQYLTNTTRAAMAADIIAKQANYKIAAVMNSGDNVDDPTSAAQWANSTNFWHAIRAAGIPHLLTVGNHDFDGVAPETIPPALTAWSQYYGSNYYAGQTWMNGGHYETNAANSWMTIRAGGRDWLLISLEWGPRTEVMDWAYAIATNRPNHYVILSTHAFLLPNGTLDGEKKQGPAYVYGVHDAGVVAGRNNAKQMWDGWLKKLPNMAAILCGHFGPRIDNLGGEYSGYEREHSIGRALLRNDAGKGVPVIMSNYQGYPTDSDQLTNGWFRYYTFDGDRMLADTYSPSYGSNRLGTYNRFVVPLNAKLPSSAVTATTSRDDGNELSTADHNDMADGLIFYAPLNEIWDTNVLDVVSGTIGTLKARDGYSLSAYGTTNGINGGGLYLGNYSYADFGNVKQPWINSLSISLWYRSENSVFGSGTFISRYGTLADSEFTFLANSLGVAAVTLTSVTRNQSAMTWNIPSGTNWMSDATWHHWGFVYDGTNCTFYFDGASQGAKVGPTGGPWLNTSTHSLFLGDYAGQGGGQEYTLNGTLDEVRMWNRPLSSSDMLRLAREYGPQVGLNNVGTTRTLTEGSMVLVNGQIVRVSGSGGAVTLTSVPTVPQGVDGQEVEVWGTSDVNTVTIRDLGTLAGSGIKLGATSRVLGLDDCVRLRYVSALGYWVECGGTFGASGAIGPDSVQLATHTTGNYVETITGTANEVTVAGSGSEAAAVTLSLPATVSLASKTEFVVPTAASPTIATAGEIAFDSDAHAASHGALKTFDGTVATVLLGVDASDVPAAGQVPKFQADGTITWEVDSSGGGEGGGIEFSILGPGAAVTDNAVVRWDNTTGTNAQNSVVIIGNAGEVTGVDSLTATNAVTAGSVVIGATNVVGELAGKQAADNDLARLAGVTWSAGDVLRADANGITNAPLTTSAHLLGFLSDEQGSGSAVFATSPTLTTPTLSGSTLSGTISMLGDFNAASGGSLALPSGASPTTDSAGEIAFDNNAYTSGRGTIQAWDGTASTYLIGALTTSVPTNGQVPTFVTGGSVVWGNQGVADGDKGDITVSGVGTSWTIDSDSVALGSDTTGNFMTGITGTANEVSVSGSVGEAAYFGVSLAATIDLGGKTSFEVPNGADPTTDAFGEVAADNNAWAASRGALEFFDGTASTWIVGVLASDTPGGGQVPKWNAGGTITWEDDNAGGVSDGDKGDITVASSGTSWSVDANAIALGTDTTGNYVATVAGTANEISVSGSGSETSDITLSFPADVTMNNLTITGSLTTTGSGGSAIDSMVVTNRLTNSALTANRLVGSATDKSLASITASTGLGMDASNLWVTNHSADLITSGTVADARVASSIARLAGPTFTGSPTLSTATATSLTINTTNLVGALSTKAEISAGGTNLYGSLAAKADLAGPTFTGSPALSTATATSITIGATNVVGALADKAPNTFAGVTNAMGNFDNDTTKYLRADGAMAVPAGGSGTSDGGIPELYTSAFNKGWNFFYTKVVDGGTTLQSMGLPAVTTTGTKVVRYATATLPYTIQTTNTAGLDIAYYHGVGGSWIWSARNFTIAAYQWYEAQFADNAASNRIWPLWSGAAGPAASDTPATGVGFRLSQLGGLGETTFRAYSSDGPTAVDTGVAFATNTTYLFAINQVGTNCYYYINGTCYATNGFNPTAQGLTLYSIVRPLNGDQGVRLMFGGFQGSAALP